MVAGQKTVTWIVLWNSHEETNDHPVDRDAGSVHSGGFVASKVSDPFPHQPSYTFIETNFWQCESRFSLEQGFCLVSPAPVIYFSFFNISEELHITLHFLSQAESSSKQYVAHISVSPLIHMFPSPPLSVIYLIPSTSLLYFFSVHFVAHFGECRKWSSFQFCPQFKSEVIV